MQHQGHSALQAVFLLSTPAAPGRGGRSSGLLPQTTLKGGAAAIAALSHKEACVAISVQLKDLPKTLFGCCHSFFWTFAFCCLVADRWRVWCRSLGGVKGHWKGGLSGWPLWAQAAAVYLAHTYNHAGILCILSTWKACATTVHTVFALHLLTCFWWTFLFDTFLASA